MGDGRRRSWEEDIYWNHFQFIHFTQFLSTTHFQQQLALPKTFSDNLKNKLPENMTLKGHSGAVWNIGLTTRDDTVYFVDGWQQFVKDQSLKENDFLVFKYNGESLFEVLIFNGESFCEKAASYFVRKCGQAHTEEEGNKGKNLNNFFEEVNTLSNGGVECASPEIFRPLNSIRMPLAVTFETTNGKTFTAGVEYASPEKVMADALTKTTTTQFPFQPTGKRTKKPVKEVTPVQTKKRGRPPKEANSSERELDLRACNKEHSEAALSKLSRKNEKKIAQSVTSSFPYFVKIIKTFNVVGPRILNVPCEFSRAHLPKGNIKIILHNLKGQRWTVNAAAKAKMQSKTRHVLSAGWLAFVHANDIKVGDVCIFELINECNLRVRIAEVGKEGLDHQNEHAKLISM